MSTPDASHLRDWRVAERLHKACPTGLLMRHGEAAGSELILRLL